MPHLRSAFIEDMWRITYLLWVLFVLVGTVVVWSICPDWMAKGESASTTIRNLGIAVAALLGLPLAIWRSMIAERSAQTADHTADTARFSVSDERFKSGVALLGNDQMAIRVSGVHILARMTMVYPDLYHLPIMDIFAAYLAYQTRGGGGPMPEKMPYISSADIGAIIDAINSRGREGIKIELRERYDWENKLIDSPYRMINNRLEGRV